MYHICAFGKTSANLGAGVYDNLTAKTDVYLSVNQANQFYLGGQQKFTDGKLRVEWGFACGTTMTLARFFSGYMQRYGFPTINPINPGLTIPSAFEVSRFNGRGPKLINADAFNVQADSAAAEVQTAFLGLWDGNSNLPSGEIFPLQGTCSIATTANQWTAGSISLTQTLPPGRWAITGMDVIGPTMMAARLVPPDGGPRPGCLARVTSAIFTPNQFRNGEFGTWFEFDSYALPTIELFNSAAITATPTITLDLVKVSG